MASAELSLKRGAIGVVDDHSGTDRSMEGHQLDELLTVDEVAALLKVSRSWVYEHTRKRGTPRSGRLTHVKVGNTSVLSREPCVSSLPDSPQSRDLVRQPPLQWPSSYSTKSQREERGALAWLDETTTVRKRVSAETRKGMGNSLAGDSRLLPTARFGVRYDTKRSARSRGEKRARHLAQRVATAGNSKAPTRSRVTFRHAGGRMAGSRAADVQALDAEESSAHCREALAAAVRGQGDRGDHATGGSSVRGVT